MEWYQHDDVPLLLLVYATHDVEDGEGAEGTVVMLWGYCSETFGRGNVYIKMMLW